MELKELHDKMCCLFKVPDASQLGSALLAAVDDEDCLCGFCDLVDNDLSEDWLQKVYQYYLADRKDKKQDYTPASIAQLMGMLTGDSEHIVDLCAGSGALIIQTWKLNPDARFTAVEIDENVIPFLLFNMVVRNIRCKILHMDALGWNEPVNEWEIMKGERFGRIANLKSAI